MSELTLLQTPSFGWFDSKMLRVYQVSTKTIIIQPGSTILRIGLGVDTEPTVLLNCFARRSKAPGRVPMTPALPRTEAYSYDPNAENRFSVTENDEKTIRNFQLDDRIYKALNTAGTTPAVKLDQNADFVPFLRGFRTIEMGSFNLEWPLTTGRFNPLISPTYALQNLEDMWSYALENYVSCSFLTAVNL